MLLTRTKAGGDMQKERQRYLSRPDVQLYLRKYPDITSEEKHDLLKWLKSGQSPASNDCNLYDEGGYPLDFIDARRTEQDLIQQHTHHLVELEEGYPAPEEEPYDLPF